MAEQQCRGKKHDSKGYGYSEDKIFKTEIEDNQLPILSSSAIHILIPRVHVHILKMLGLDTIHLSFRAWDHFNTEIKKTNDPSIPPRAYILYLTSSCTDIEYYQGLVAYTSQSMGLRNHRTYGQQVLRVCRSDVSL